MAQANILIAVNTLNVNNVLNQLNQIGNVGQNASAKAKSAIDKLKAELSSASRTLGAIRTVVTVLGIKEAIQDFAALSDSMTNARNRLSVVSKGNEDVSATMFQLKQVALDTRSDFDLTTRSYARTTQALRALGTTQSQNIQITKTLQQAIAVSGATSEEAHATLIQLTQAMASNRLSADEFRSVAEQLPIVLDMIASATGKPRTELKKLGEDGRLTAAVMAYSILKAQAEIQASFDKTMPTISQAWTNLGTQVKFAIDKFNQATGASQSIVTFLQFLASHTDQAAHAFTILAGTALPLVVMQIGKLSIALRALAIANPWVLALAAVGGLGAALYYRKEDFEGPKGHSMSKQEYADFKERRKYTPGTEEYTREQQRLDIQRQVDAQHMRKLEEQAMHDINTPGKPKKGRGRHIPTFAEAVNDLEGDVANLTLTKQQRVELEGLMKVQDKLNGSLREGDVGYKHLNKTQREYVTTLLEEKRILETREKADALFFKLRFEREQRMEKLQKERMEATLKNRMQELQDTQDRTDRLKRAIRMNDFGEFTDDKDIAKTREMVGAGNLSNKQSILNRLEIQDKNTKPIRKQFLEELEGIGKFKQDIDNIFGPDGSIATGFSRAIATSAIFHKNFKAQIHDLSKSIQAEILQTLIQGLIRMAILSAMGGGTASGAGAVVGGIIRTNPYGEGKAAGGFVSGPRTRIMGYHHGGEFIVNAAATEQNRDVLEAINSGKSVASRGASSQMSVTVHSYGVDIQTQQTGPNSMVMIARQVAREEAGAAVAASMHDPSSHMSKSMQLNYGARRAR